ncbi:hypothetical protein Y032_0045g1205 [Ancylostoma ceylanicum]|uniref:Reverse transcriptase domain-containing protein n=1 Tax=Ancylostoma ceylanicum TaxID=53326 RepID=A0A016UDL6_9BILA|nr:hypothetical protein Y032_0045g1205 [Ancylostoma ceylanicum]
MAKATHYGKSNKDLDTRDGERLIYRLAKSSRRQAEDVKKFREINEEHGKLLVYYRKDIVNLPTNKCGFVARCGTTDAIHATRLLIEKHREKQKALHTAFLNLEKAFDRVQPEELVEWVQILYAYLRSQIQALAGTSAELPVVDGSLQGSALSLLFFIFVMDAVTRDLQDPATWKLLSADDLTIASLDKCELERLTKAWSDRLAQFGLCLYVTMTKYLTNLST